MAKLSMAAQEDLSNWEFLNQSDLELSGDDDDSIYEVSSVDFVKSIDSLSSSSEDESGVEEGEGPTDDGDVDRDDHGVGDDVMGSSPPPIPAHLGNNVECVRVFDLGENYGANHDDDEEEDDDDDVMGILPPPNVDSNEVSGVRLFGFDYESNRDDIYRLLADIDPYWPDFVNAHQLVNHHPHDEVDFDDGHDHVHEEDDSDDGDDDNVEGIADLGYGSSNGHHHAHDDDAMVMGTPPNHTHLIHNAKCFMDAINDNLSEYKRFDVGNGSNGHHFYEEERHSGVVGHDVEDDGAEDEDEDDIDDGYDLDDELVPWDLKNKFERQRIKKLGNRVFSKMAKSKRSAFLYNKPVRGKHGALKAYY